MSGLVRVLWHQVGIAEQVLPPYYTIKVVDETIAVPEAHLARGVLKVGVVADTISIPELMNAVGAQRTVILNEPVMIVPTMLFRGPLKRQRNRTLGISEAVRVVLSPSGRKDDSLAGGNPGELLGLIADIPPLNQADVDKPTLYAMACSWSRRSTWQPPVKVFQNLDGQTHEYAYLNDQATMGIVKAKAYRHEVRNQWDNASTLDVYVVSGDLESKSEEEVLGGANTIVIGAEIMGFRTATPLTFPFEYRLSGLLRGRFQSDFDQSEDTNSGVWGLLSGPGVVPLEWAWGDIDVVHGFGFIPHGIPVPDEADHSQEQARLVPRARNLRPFMVNGVTGVKETNNDWTLTWTRTSRLPRPRVFSPRGVIDADSDPRNYSVEIQTSATDATVVRTLIVAGAEFGDFETATYTASQQTTDFGSSQTTIYVNIYRTNTWGNSLGNRKEVVA